MQFIGGIAIGAKNEALFPGRVPHVRPSVHGPKTHFSNAFIPCAGILPLGRSPLHVWQSVGTGCAQSFSAHVRWGEHGAPVQSQGPCLGVQSLLVASGTRIKLHLLMFFQNFLNLLFRNGSIWPAVYFFSDFWIWQRCQISRLFREDAQGAQVINLSILPL